MTKQRWLRAFAERLRTMMALKKINQRELALMARISPPMIGEYLEGRAMPSAYNAVKIARALEVQVEYLIGFIA